MAEFTKDQLIARAKASINALAPLAKNGDPLARQNVELMQMALAQLEDQPPSDDLRDMITAICRVPEIK